MSSTPLADGGDAGESSTIGQMISLNPVHWLLSSPCVLIEFSDSGSFTLGDQKSKSLVFVELRLATRSNASCQATSNYPNHAFFDSHTLTEGVPRSIQILIPAPFCFLFLSLYSTSALATTQGAISSYVQASHVSCYAPST